MHPEHHIGLDNLDTVENNLRRSAKGSNDAFDVTHSLTDRALHHKRHVPPLNGGPGDYDHADFETDAAKPEDDDDIAFLASCSFESLQLSILLPLGFPPLELVCVQLSMAFPDDFRDEFVPRSPVSPFGLELENIIEDHGGVLGRFLTKCLHWRWRPIGAAFQRNWLTQHSGDRKNESALSF